MARQVEWTKRIVETFAELAMLSDLEKGILETRIKGMTISQQAIHFSMSESSISRSIKKMKRLYDLVQPTCPDILPVRRSSKEEEYMDKH